MAGHGRARSSSWVRAPTASAPSRRARRRILAGSAKDEAFGERIVRGDKELVASGDPGASLHLGDDGVVSLPAQRAQRAADEPRSDDALHDEWLIDPDPAAGALDGDAGGNAGAGRRAIDFPFRE